MVACASGCLTPSQPPRQPSGFRAAGMSDAEMGLTEPGAGGDSHCVIEVLRRLSSRFGSG